METADLLVVGGGIVGLTAALEARRRDPGGRVVVLEKEERVGRHASGRNSGVLHAGIYYQPGSLKARFAKDGNARLTAYCQDRGLPIRLCGKLVLATTDSEQDGLDELFRRGRASGVEVHEVSEREARDLDPAARVRDRALFSPTTSAVDPVAVTRSLARDAEDAGIELQTGVGFEGRHRGEVITTRGRWSVGYVLNAAGLHADRIARRFGFGEGHVIMPFKGRYLRARKPIGIRCHLYPVPDLRYPFLGVHFTIAANGDVWIGPTATPVLAREQYRLRDILSRESIPMAGRLAALLTKPSNGGLRRLALKELKRHSRRALVTEGSRLARHLPGPRHWESVRSGIRAQLVNTRKWKLEQDFVYEADDRSCHVLNAVSPGFTCALPLAEHLLDIIEDHRG